MKAHPFLKANLEALQRLNAPIFQWLTTQNPDVSGFDGNIITNKHGLLDWSLPNGQGLFDSISQQVAYRDWIPKDKTDTSATVIVGSNLGYGVNHVLANTPHSHQVLVLEPRPEILLACLSQTDYRDFFETGKLFFVPPDREFLGGMGWQLALQYVFGNIFLRSDMPCRQLGPEYAAWTGHIKEALEDFSCGITTLRRAQDIMVKNELKNFSRAMRDGNLLALKNQGQGLSAVVLGAGPSLADFAPLLAEKPGGALYTCGLQTLPALQEHGLKPHLCMAVDYTTALKKVFDRLDMERARDIPLIYSLTLDPEVLNAYPGPTIPVWTLGGLSSNMPQDREFVLATRGNVGVALTRFLAWCGVDQIILAGQDFAWQGEKTHVSGHLSDENSFCFNPERHIKMKNKDGETIYSDLAYVTPLRGLESDLKQLNIPVFNLYGGGAVIEGSIEVTWEQVLSEGLVNSTPGSLEHFLKAMNQCRAPRPWPVFEARSIQWAGSLYSVEKRLKKLFKKASECQEEIHKIFNQILLFLRQDPLYQPYLFKEILGMAGLVHARPSYGFEELAECRKIVKRVLEKVRAMDQHLIYDRKAA